MRNFPTIYLISVYLLKNINNRKNFEIFLNTAFEQSFDARKFFQQLQVFPVVPQKYYLYINFLSMRKTNIFLLKLYFVKTFFVLKKKNLSRKSFVSF